MKLPSGATFGPLVSAQHLDLPSGMDPAVGMLLTIGMDRQISDTIEVAPGQSSLVIHAQTGARATVLLHLEGTSSVHVILEAGAQMHVVCLQSEDAETAIKQSSILAERAVLDWHNVTLGGHLKQSLRSDVRGTHARSTVDWIAYASGTDRQELAVRNAFDAPAGGGEVTMRCIAQERASVRANGMIDIEKEGGGTVTYLTQEVLMLDPTAKVDAVPGLEIKTNDVKASHSASVARVTEDDLFYFAARGIPQREARRMYVTGFLGGLVERIPDAAAREMVLEAVERKYDESAKCEVQGAQS